MYYFIPNTRVQFKPALIGGVTAGIVWALVGKVFTALILYSSEMMAVYTGFAIVLTTLIWVNLSWLILLIGAQLAFYVQFPQYLRYGERQLALTYSDQEQAALSVMYLIGRDYRAGGPHWTCNRLAAELDVPAAALAPVLGCLEDSSLLVATEKELLLPGRDPAAIELATVIQAVRTGPGLRINSSALPGASRTKKEGRRPSIPRFAPVPAPHSRLAPSIVRMQPMIDGRNNCAPRGGRSRRRFWPPLNAGGIALTSVVAPELNRSIMKAVQAFTAPCSLLAKASDGRKQPLFQSLRS